MMHTTVL